MTKAEQSVAKFLEILNDYGWKVSGIRGGVVEITKRITPNCNESFSQADGEYYHILEKLPGRLGSMWGTDGGSIGGMTAMNTGFFVMKRSGVSKAGVAALKKMM